MTPSAWGGVTLYAVFSVARTGNAQHETSDTSGKRSGWNHL